MDSDKEMNVPDTDEEVFISKGTFVYYKGSRDIGLSTSNPTGKIKLSPASYRRHVKSSSGIGPTLAERLNGL